MKLLLLLLLLDLKHTAVLQFSMKLTSMICADNDLQLHDLPSLVGLRRCGIHPAVLACTYKDMSRKVCQYSC
jgi:hypothetical protein